MTQPDDPLLTEPRENIILVGFMGSGKSSVGRQVASILGWEAVDTDAIVQRQKSQEIRTIFEFEGEDAFRKYESHALHSLGLSTYRVISTGGGIVKIAENIPLLQKMGCIVWLHATEEVILDRISRTQHRPLLAVENPAGEIHRLLQERLPLYQDIADVSIDSSELSHEEVAELVVEKAFAFLSGGWKSQRRAY